MLVLLVILLLENGQYLIAFLALLLALLKFISNEYELMVNLLIGFLSLLLCTHILVHLSIVSKQVVSVLPIVLSVLFVQIRFIDLVLLAQLAQVGL